MTTARSRRPRPLVIALLATSLAVFVAGSMSGVGQVIGWAITLAITAVACIVAATWTAIAVHGPPNRT